MELKTIFEKFDCDDAFVSGAIFGDGHINRTYLIETTGKKYVLQQINHHVFPNVEGLMSNIIKVTEHIEKQGGETLHFHMAKNGQYYVQHEETYYRLYEFIDKARTYTLIPGAEILFEAASAFSQFQKDLQDFPASQLFEVIPFFHDTRKRYKDFLLALNQASDEQKEECKEEIAFILAHENDYGILAMALENGDIPLRVTHNDTKLNNVLIDTQTQKARAVIDLDTIMPGSALYDFGDAIRFCGNTGAEDEKDLSKIHFSLSNYEAYTKGFLSKLKDVLTESEICYLPFSAFLMTMECGMRFLADYFNGNVYFHVQYEKHNLVRCRTQMKLAREMEEHRKEMQEIVNKLL